MLLFPTCYKPSKFSIRSKKKKKCWEKSNPAFILNTTEVTFPISTQALKVRAHHGSYIKFQSWPTSFAVHSSYTRRQIQLDRTSTYDGEEDYRQMKQRNVQLPRSHSPANCEILASFISSTCLQEQLHRYCSIKDLPSPFLFLTSSHLHKYDTIRF